MDELERRGDGSDPEGPPAADAMMPPEGGSEAVTEPLSAVSVEAGRPLPQATAPGPGPVAGAADGTAEAATAEAAAPGAQATADAAIDGAAGPLPAARDTADPLPAARDTADPLPAAPATDAAPLEHPVLEDGADAVPTGSVPTAPVVATAAGATPPGRRRRGLAAIGYVVAAIAGAALVAVAFVGSGAASFGPSPSPSPTFSVTGTTVGVPGAPVTIEVWADYQCPYCGLFTHGIEPTLFRDYAATGRATVAFRDFAFLGQESIDAAVASRCAERQGKFWTYHDLLYASQNGENQGAFRRANLDALADFASLDRTAFDACLADPAVAKAIADETAAGRGFGISSTPTIRITGPGGSKLVKGISQPSQIEAAVASVATVAPSGSPSGGSGSPSGSGSPAPSGGASPGASGSSPGPASPASSSPGASGSGG